MTIVDVKSSFDENGLAATKIIKALPSLRTNRYVICPRAIHVEGVILTTRHRLLL